LESYQSEDHHVTQQYSCPVDGTALVMSERQGIEIDYCPACRGVWLDRGELDKIVEKSAGQAPTPGPAAQPDPWAAQPAHPAHHGHGYGYKPHKRRKSFLEELFD
jgi:Zn-finger nucleic acid-binding protein